MRYITEGSSFLLSLALSLICTPLVRRLALKYKFVSFPKQDRWRSRVVATLGGIAIFVSTVIACAIFARRDLRFAGYLFGALGIFWLGLVDDIVTIKPDTKLIGQIIVACIVIMFGIRFNVTANALINIPLTVFWIVGIINAFNLLDNMDGLCAGIASISAMMLAVHSAINDNGQVIVLSLALIGSTLGFLRYNFNPAKIFMGDCGSMFLGYTLAVSALMGSPKEKSSLFMTILLPAMVLIVPIFDTTFVALNRMFHSKPVSQGGRDHTSHRLVSLGLSERNAVLFLYLVSFACGLGGLLYNRLNFLHLSILSAILLTGLVMLGIFLGTEVKVYNEADLKETKIKKQLNGKIVFNGFIYNKKRIVEVILDFILIAISYISAFILRFEGVLFGINIQLILESLPVVLIIKILTFYYFGLYRGVWRYVGLYDLIAIFKATLLSSVFSIVVLVFFFRFKYFSRTVFVIDWLLTLVSISGARLIFRLYMEFFANLRFGGKRVLIFGAGDRGELALREIRHNASLGYKAIGFVDDDKEKLNRLIHGVKVLGSTADLEKLIRVCKIDEVLVAIPVSDKKKCSEIYGICTGANIAFRQVSKIIQSKKEEEV